MHPFLAPHFHVRWSTLVPEAVEPDLHHALNLAKANLDEVTAWGRQHPLNTRVSERDFILGSIPADGLGN